MVKIFFPQNIRFQFYIGNTSLKQTFSILYIMFQKNILANIYFITRQGTYSLRNETGTSISLSNRGTKSPKQNINKPNPAMCKNIIHFIKLCLFSNTRRVFHCKIYGVIHVKMKPIGYISLEAKKAFNKAQYPLIRQILRKW